MSTAASPTDAGSVATTTTSAAPRNEALAPPAAKAAAENRANAQGDRSRTGASRRRDAGIRWWVELLVVAWLALIYDFVNNLAPLRLGPALSHGRDILSAERALGISPELSLDRWLTGRHTLGLWVSYYYDNAHFIVTFALLGYLWLRRGDIYKPLRTSLVLINFVGFIVFWLYPVAPPRMLDGFTDIVQASGAYGSWHSGALASDANQLAAMPSLHIAWALWCSVAIWRITEQPLLRAIAVVYPFVTAFAVLATGNHYLLDMLAGAVLALGVLSAVAFAPRTRLAEWATGLRVRHAAT